MRSTVLLAVALMVAACSTNEQACAERDRGPGSEGYASCIRQREQAQREAQDRVRSFQSGQSIWTESVHPPVCVGRTCY